MDRFNLVYSRLNCLCAYKYLMPCESWFFLSFALSLPHLIFADMLEEGIKGNMTEKSVEDDDRVYVTPTDRIANRYAHYSHCMPSSTDILIGITAMCMTLTTSSGA